MWVRQLDTALEKHHVTQSYNSTSRSMMHSYPFRGNWDSQLRLWVETQKWTAAPERQPEVKRDLLAEGDRCLPRWKEEATALRSPPPVCNWDRCYYVLTVTESQKAKVLPSQRTWWRRSALGAPGSPSPNRCGPPVVGWSCGWFSSSSASGEGKVQD